MFVMCDVDSTLYDADAHFARVARECEITWPSKALYWFSPAQIGHEMFEVKNMFRRAHSREWVMKTIPYPGAAEVLNWVAELGHKVLYVSDRHKQAEGALREWLATYEFLRKGQEVICTSDKRHWIRDHRPEIVIDDRVRTIAMARYEIGATCFAIKHNHNINLVNEIPQVYVCDDWNELGEILQKEIVAIEQETNDSRTVHSFY